MPEPSTTIGYLDLPSGLSGDMLLGCLLDCGWSIERLRATILALPISHAEWAVQVETVAKGELRATRADVLFEEGRHQRRLADITDFIEQSSLPQPVRQRAVAVFNRLAHAEARVHGTSPEKVHFHEVGAVDAIIDIVASVNGLHELGVSKLYASALPLGHGWTRSAHGPLPLPAPATLELLSAVAAPTRPAPGEEGELVTPTAAALLAELATFELPMMRLNRIGIGAGQREFAWPNIARLWLGQPNDSGCIVQLETNIDDMNPQLYAQVSDKLFAAGARDVWLTPVQMKKGRPGVVLAVLADADRETAIADLILRQTTTFGVRSFALDRRHEARREFRQVVTPLGSMQMKLKWVGHELIDAAPEYEDCRLIAERTGASLLRVEQSARAASEALLQEERSPSTAAS